LRDPDGHPPLDEGPIFQALARHGVDYVLVGGVAARLHGATRPTQDLDICVSYDTQNLIRLVAALNQLGAKFRGIWDELPPVSVESLRRMEIGTWRTPAGDLDVFIGIPDESGLMCYETLLRKAVAREVAGCNVFVGCLEHIIASKQHAKRAHDRNAFPELEALLAAQPSEQRDMP
jgi:hypothetical protein